MPIAPPAIGSIGAVASVTGVQKLGDSARAIVTTSACTITHMLGKAAKSMLPVSDNGVQTVATGNLTSGNLPAPGRSPGGGAVGTALTTPDDVQRAERPGLWKGQHLRGLNRHYLDSGLRPVSCNPLLRSRKMRIEQIRTTAGQTARMR